jgi:type II secretory ATPase GspE/PulE/Tfp pilus assembly ATPase PilB-like protein
VDLTLGLLAQLPTSYTYINPFKVAGVVIVYALWALLAQWVDKDTVAVNTFRVLWNGLTIGAGALALLLVVFVPMFAITLPGMIVVIGSIAVAYVVHRNKLVPEQDRVMTAAHFRRLKEQGFSGKKKVKEVKERVRLTNAQKKVVPIPADDPEREYYRLTQDLMFNALWRRATNVEIVPASQQVCKVTLIVDGQPVEVEPLPRAEGEAVVQYIKNMAGLNMEERRKPQKGQIMAAVGENKHRVFVRTDGSTAGEKMNIRVIYKETEYKVPDLGFNPKQLEQVLATKEDTKGLIVVLAPPGQGLTTSIYSFTRTHDRFLQNVQMIEFEKELDVDNVTQVLFNPGEGATFGEKLLKIVRADPDIIVLPELRDRDAAAVAAKAAGEKQKIYIGIIASDVFEALRKWTALVGDKTLVARSLMGVANQRLLRVLCRECKQAYKPDPQMMRKLNLPDDKVLYRVPEPQVDKHGNPIICQNCHGAGYVGRTAVFDWLAVDDGLREVIRKSSSLADVQNYALKRGGIGLQNQALQKVLDGITSIDEVRRMMKSDAAAPAAAKPAAAPTPQPRPVAAPRPQPKPQAGGGTPAGGR